MLNLKSIMLGLFLVIAVCFQSYSQQADVFISEKKLNEIFNSQSCIFSQMFETSILWEEEYGLKFLLKKLDGKNDIDKILAISYLSNTKSPEFIDVIAPYLNSDTESIARSAAQALTIIGTAKSISLLENKLLSIDKKFATLHHIILKGLHTLTSKSSLIYLDSFINKCDITIPQEVIYSKMAQEISETIMNYNFSIDNQRKLIENALFSKDSEDFNWAIVKIRQTKDTTYLPLLDEVSDYMNLNHREMKVILLMDFLGKRDFNNKQTVLLGQLKKLERMKIAKTMEFLKQPEPLINREDNDF